MAKATKATINRLKKMHKEFMTTGNNYQGNVLYEYIQIAENSEALFNEGYEGFETNAIYTENGLIITVKHDIEKRSLQGLYTRYPNLISTTFTHGNNQCIISDINKLVKTMINDAENN